MDVERLGVMEKLLRYLNKGHADDYCRRQLGLSHEDYLVFKRKALVWEGEKIRNKSVEEIYVEYMIEQKKCIKDLEKMSKKFDKVKHYSALVASVKARSEIHEKIVKTGQDFGILDRKAERKEIFAGILVTKMNDDQLREVITKELSGLAQMKILFGGKHISELPEATIHRDLIDVTPKKGKVKRGTVSGHKSKANKVHGGRRVIKGMKDE